MKYLILIILGLINSFEFSQVTICEVGPPGKCMWQPQTEYDVGMPSPNASEITVESKPDYISCKLFCVGNLQCFMAAFDTDRLTCTLYRNIVYTGTSQSNIELFRWHCCNTNSSYEAPGRCPGFWARKVLALSNNRMRTSDPLVQLKGFNQYQCKMKCLSNRICGGANVLRQDVFNSSLTSCQLIIQFPVEDLVLVNSSLWDTYQWQCAHNYSLPDPPRDCTPRVNNRKGYWKVENTSMVLRNDRLRLIFFYTFNYLECIHNCGLYTTCKRAWYSPLNFYCLLEADKKESCSQETEFKEYLFTTYTWEVCKSLPNRERSFTKPNKIYNKNVKLFDTFQNFEDRKCRTLIDNRYTYIYPIHCGRPPTEKYHLVPCWQTPTTPHGTTFSFNLHCQSNQSFQSLGTFTHPPSFFPNVTWQRVFTGYESFWLVNVTDTNFPLTSEDQCSIFDASMDPSNQEPLRIMKRFEWFPPKVLRPEAPFAKHPVKFIVIIDIRRPLCNCFSIGACSFIMRNIQKILQPEFYSIPYNFVVTGDGVAYEARGFDLEAQAVGAEYNRESLVIALCGRYIKNPNVKALNSVKQLIKMVVGLKKVSKNYTLYMYNDIRGPPYPYEGLRRVLELWPHYRGHVRKHCLPIFTSTIIMNVLFAMLTCLLIGILLDRFIHTLWHNRSCSLVRMCRIEMIFSNISVESKEILPMILLQNSKYLLREERYMSIYNSLVFWIEDLQEISIRRINQVSCSCKSEIFSILNLCRLQSKLVNVGCILRLPEVRRCSRKIAFIFHRNVEMDKECLLILHFTHECSFHIFVCHLHQGKCVCDHFKLIQYDPRRQPFVTDFMTLNQGLFSSKRKNFKSLEEKFAFVKEYNHTVHYC